MQDKLSLGAPTRTHWGGA